MYSILGTKEKLKECRNVGKGSADMNTSIFREFLDLHCDHA
jgi:hypothetical protein